MVSREELPIVFVNAAAGGGRARSGLKCVRRVFEQRIATAEFVETTSRQHLQDMALAAIARGSRMLMAMGGDGTAQSLVEAAMGHEVVLGIIPGGGGNDFASALGFSSNPATATRLLVDGEVRRVDVAQVRTADGTKRIYLEGGGIGLDVAAAKLAAERYRNWPRRWRYVAAAVHAYGTFEPFRVCVEFPGTELTSVALQRNVSHGSGQAPCHGAAESLYWQRDASLRSA